MGAPGALTRRSIVTDLLSDGMNAFQAHLRLLGIGASVDVRRMFLDVDVRRPSPFEARDASRDSELDGIDHAALSGAIGPADSKIPLIEHQRQFTDAAKLFDVDLFDPDHEDEPSGPNSAYQIGKVQRSEENRPIREQIAAIPRPGSPQVATKCLWDKSEADRSSGSGEGGRLGSVAERAGFELRVPIPGVEITVRFQ